MPLREDWGGSLHSTFRLLPTPATHLRPFLQADGKTEAEVLATLPYDRARAGATPGAGPDPKRYRDGRQVYQTAGMLYEDETGVVRVTELGKATLRWLDIITDKNAVILARHAAYALAACQLRNPTGSGQKYATTVEVFPFSFIWRAMLALDCKINSDEINRAIFRVRNEHELTQAIEQIAASRAANDSTLMGDETITGTGKDDRIIPWMALASFGWTLFADKRAGVERGYYHIPARTFPLVHEAARVRHRHREFASVRHYVEHISRAAALPKDLR